jgi:2-oxoglutarate dehydrogenase E2 component (dihydrolipoamide succinyltransferase)
MAKIEILLPAMGEGIIEATITKWLVKEGEQVSEDQSIVEIATDKVDSEIPAPQSGIIQKILITEGSVPKIGDTIAILQTEKGEITNEVSPLKPEKEITKAETILKAVVINDNKAIGASNQEEALTNYEGKFLSPLVKSIAKKENIQPEELSLIRGTSNTGRITKADIINYLQNRKSTGVQASVQPIVSKTTATAPQNQIKPAIGKEQLYGGGEYEIVQMDRMRKIIADHMVYSKQVSPHVTSFVEADVTDMVLWRNKNKDAFQAREKQKLTFTPLFIEATVKALKDFPMINVAVDEDKIIVKKNINIGMATALPSGNLIVPVIKNADRLNLSGIVASVNDLAERSRDNKLKPDEIQGGTFTITNFGTFGNISGTPIINQPQVAILGIGSIVKKPAVIETPSGDAIAIRHIMILSLAYDHRVVDGALGGMFLKRIADYLEKFDLKRNI